MPIPLGVLAVAGAGAGPSAGAAYEWLETQTLGTATASIEFTNVNTNYASTYQHLQVRIAARTTKTGEVGAQLKMTLNGTDLNTHVLVGTGSIVESQYYTTEDIMVWVTGNDATADVFGAGIIDILDPFETSKNTTVRSFSGSYAQSVPRVGLGSGALFSTNAITSIAFADRQGANLAIGTRISLYGLRSA